MMTACYEPKIMMSSILWISHHLKITSQKKKTSQITASFVSSILLTHFLSVLMLGRGVVPFGRGGN